MTVKVGTTGSGACESQDARIKNMPLKASDPPPLKPPANRQAAIQGRELAISIRVGSVHPCPIFLTKSTTRRMGSMPQARGNRRCPESRAHGVRARYADLHPPLPRPLRRGAAG